MVWCLWFWVYGLVFMVLGLWFWDYGFWFSVVCGFGFMVVSGFGFMVFSIGEFREERRNGFRDRIGGSPGRASCLGGNPYR